MAAQQCFWAVPGACCHLRRDSFLRQIHWRNWRALQWSSCMLSILSSSLTWFKWVVNSSANIKEHQHNQSARPEQHQVTRWPHDVPGWWAGPAPPWFGRTSLDWSSSAGACWNTLECNFTGDRSDWIWRIWTECRVTRRCHRLRWRCT